LESPVAVAELNLAQLEQIRQGAGIHYHDVVPYPFMERDMSLEVPQEFLTADLIATINQEGGKYFRDLSIFDVYSGKGIQQGKRSIGFRLYFQSRERTLTDEEVDQQVQRIAEALSRRHQVVWRQS